MDPNKPQSLNEAGFRVGDAHESLGSTDEEVQVAGSQVHGVQQRLAFADFLRRVAAGNVGAIEWNRFVVTHYRDEFLEEVRRRLVRMSIERDGGKEWSESEYAALQQWSRELRNPCPGDIQQSQ